jgi:putative transposase
MNLNHKEFQWKNRINLRLKGYDYSNPGAYFITICANKHAPILTEKEDIAIIQGCWNELPLHYDNVVLDEFIIMPDHIHGIIILKDKSGREGLRPSPTEKHEQKQFSLIEIVRGFKSFSSRKINIRHRRSGYRFWQRGYYEHVIRNKEELQFIRDYIRENPQSNRSLEIH